MSNSKFKILIIGPSWIGDMVMAQSLFIKLKELNPNCEITVTAPNWSLPLLERMPEISKTLANPFGHGDFAFGKRREMGKKLKDENFDLAIILPNSFKSALVPYFAQIKKRRGLKGEQRYIVLNEIYKNIKKKLPLMVQRYVALAYNPTEFLPQKPEDLGKIPFPHLNANKENIPQICQNLSIEHNDHVLGICPGAEYGNAKRWPAEYYAKVAETWIKNRGIAYIFGSHKDLPVAQNLINAIDEKYRNKCFIITGKTSLPEAVDLLAGCEIVVTNDSGLMHVTAAVKTPLVAIYGSSTTNYTPPLSDKAEVVALDLKCRPCFKRECPFSTTECLKKIYPNIVLEKINKMLNINMTISE